MAMRLRRGFNVLALVATLALALVPTLGRLWHGPVVPYVHAGHEGTPVRGASGQQQPHVAGHSDCGYCALLAGLALPPTPSAAVLALAAGDGGHGDGSRGRGPSTAGHGLGARGPPDAA